MSNKNKNNLSWADFQKLGDPTRVPEEKETSVEKPDHFIAKSIIRVHLEKKGRGGKPVSIIKGLQMTNTLMKDLERKLKSHCGVGGTQKNQEIIIQGDQREKIIAFLTKLGAKDIKKAGA